MGGKGSGGQPGTGRKSLYLNDEVQKITVSLPTALVNHFEAIGGGNVSQGIVIETETQFRVRPIIERRAEMEGKRITKLSIPTKARTPTDPWGNYGRQSIDVPLEPGTEFYLIEVSHLLNKWPDHWVLQIRPGLTNSSGEEKIYGWLGTTNDVHKQAWGKYRLDAFEETKTKIVLHITRIE